MAPAPKLKSISDPSSSTSHSQKNSKAARKRPQHKKYPHTPAADSSSSSNALPGVQKIKAALRQTRRLLAKDTLAADVRVATERRLRALEADLARAEQARLERAMAARYHKIKFFERQKVVRKIAQVKRELAAPVTGEEKGKKADKERRRLEGRLEELRVDLNYILHYPKTKKYISLFPPEIRQGGKERDREQVAREEKEKSETDRQREEVRKWVREQMEAGALSSEPEVELGKAEARGAAATTGKFGQAGVGGKGAKDGETKSTSKAAGNAVADDDFFAMDKEAAEESSEEGPSGEGEGGSESEEDSEMAED